MIKAECDNCGKDKVGDYIYCQSCYKALEEKLNDTQSNLDDANREIERNQDEIKNLKEKLINLQEIIDNLNDQCVARD